MFFPVSKNTNCLKMKNFHKQNFPLRARSSPPEVGKALFCKDGIGRVRRGSGSAPTSAQLLGKKTKSCYPCGAGGWKHPEASGSRASE